MITILFTTGKKSPISWLIRKVTKEDCSHCVIRYGDLVIHSDFFGVRVETIETFLKRAKVLHQVRFEDVEFDLKNVLENHTGKMYDVLGFFYLGLRLLFPFLPKKNLWQTSGMYLCTELVSSVLDNEELSSITPHKLYTKLKDEQEGR